MSRTSRSLKSKSKSTEISYFRKSACTSSGSSEYVFPPNQRPFGLLNPNKLVEYYVRMVKDVDCPYTTQLVYTSDNKVTSGFGKKILLK